MTQTEKFNDDQCARETKNELKSIASSLVQTLLYLNIFHHCYNTFSIHSQIEYVCESDDDIDTGTTELPTDDHLMMDKPMMIFYGCAMNGIDTSTDRKGKKDREREKINEIL